VETVTEPSTATVGRWAQFQQMARQVAAADPSKIESWTNELANSRRYLAPLAWAAGALVLAIKGIKLLVVNWRLSLIELVPAVWVWVVMWDLKQHTLRGAAFRQLTVGGAILMAVAAIGLSIASFWCNTVFGFAIEDDRAKVGPAIRQANRYLKQIATAGLIIGGLLANAAIGIPRVGSRWLFVLTLGAVLSVMLISFVAIPARIVGAIRQKLPLKESIGRMAAGGALSAVAMSPGFLLDRLGLILIGAGARITGLILLSIGTALYAAGMSSVRVVKLTMKIGVA
jgi:hypothetical protein